MISFLHTTETVKRHRLNNNNNGNNDTNCNKGNCEKSTSTQIVVETKNNANEFY